jgi:mannose-binding lectin 1
MGLPLLSTRMEDGCVVDKIWFSIAFDLTIVQGGSVRGFLNDGTTDYKSHTNVDSLAFGHCDYSYRNLGRPSIVQIKQTSSNFEVSVDNKLCFQTDKVSNNREER